MNECLIVIVSLDQLNYTKNCIRSILQNTEYFHKVLIVDNGSQEETLNYLRSLKKDGVADVIFNSENIGWVEAVNQGLFYSRAPYVCIMNNDVIVYPGWLEEMINGFKVDKIVGIVNPLWELPKRFKGGRDRYFKKVVKKQKGQYINTDWARGFCYVVKREVINVTGGLDQDFSPAYYDDWDFSLRIIKKGYKCVRATGSFVYHYKNISYPVFLGQEEFSKNFNEKALLFHKRWGYPLKIFFVIDKSLEKNMEAMRKLVFSLLRDQNKVHIISSTKINVNHSNCNVKKAFFMLFKIKLIIKLLNNSRHSLKKRFDIIICSANVKDFLEKFSFIRNHYNLQIIDKSNDNKSVDSFYLEIIKNNSISRKIIQL